MRKLWNARWIIHRIEPMLKLCKASFKFIKKKEQNNSKCSMVCIGLRNFPRKYVWKMATSSKNNNILNPWHNLSIVFIYLLCLFFFSRADYVHVILWDVPPQQFVDSFDPHLKGRLTDQPFSYFLLSTVILLISWMVIESNKSNLLQSILLFFQARLC